MKAGNVLRTLTAGACAFAMLPLAMLLVMSFSGQSFVSFPPDEWSTDWWRMAMENDKYRSAAWLSSWTALVSAMLAIAIAVPTSLCLVRFKPPGAKVLASLTFLPLIIPQFVIGISLIDLLYSWEMPLAPVGTIIAATLIATPFAVSLISANLAGIPLSLEVASQGLGASRWMTARRVLLPQMMPSLVASFVLTFLIAFEVLDAALFLTTPEAKTLPVRIFEDLQFQLTPLPIAASAILLCTTAALFLILEKIVGVLGALVPDLDFREPRRREMVTQSKGNAHEES